MTDQVIRKLELSDLPYLEDNLLEINKKEIMASRGVTVGQVFKENPEMLDASEVLEIDGEIICVGGGIDTDVGHSIWLLGTRKLEQYRKRFTLVTSRRVNLLKQKYDVIYSAVFSENEVTKKWLLGLGFTIFDPQPVGINGEMFHYFEWRKQCVIQ